MIFSCPLKRCIPALFHSDQKSSQAYFYELKKKKSPFTKEQTIKSVNYSSSHEHGLSHCATCILGKCEKLYWAEGILEGKGKKKKGKQFQQMEVKVLDLFQITRILQKIYILRNSCSLDIRDLIGMRPEDEMTALNICPQGMKVIYSFKK